jgi:hypothetical protein
MSVIVRDEYNVAAPRRSTLALDRYEETIPAHATLPA